VICALSGLLAEAVMLDGLPDCTVLGLAEQLTCGGFIGFAFTVKLAAHVADPPFFILASLMVALAL
jgi:hypothetical protein